MKPNKLIDVAVERFLSWKLPEDFNPDAGISFEPEYNVEYMASQGKPPMRHEPVGTNLFDATQTREMVEHIFPQLPDCSVLLEALKEIREIYAGMEGFIPETAPEGYCQHIIKQMYEAAQRAIAEFEQALEKGDGK